MTLPFRAALLCYFSYWWLTGPFAVELLLANLTLEDLGPPRVATAASALRLAFTALSLELLSASGCPKFAVYLSSLSRALLEPLEMPMETPLAP